jgi:hypothetical protein
MFIAIANAIGANRASGVKYDADYQAILNKAISEGFTLPNDAEKLKQNQLVIDLKASGAWAKADHILVLATNSNQSFARIDWRNPTRLATLVNAPTFVPKKGFQGGGTAYINTNYNPFTGVKYTQNNASRFVFMDTASGTGVFDGCGTTDRNLMFRNLISNQRINSNVALTGGAFSFTATRGMKSIHRTSSTNLQLFNDTTGESRTATSATMVNSNQFILRSGPDGAPIYGAHTISFYMMGESMISENSSIITAINTYLNSL